MTATKAAERPADHGLRASLGPRAPDPIEVGGGTSVLLEGTLESTRRFPLDGVGIRVGEIERRVDAFGIAGRASSAPRWWSLVPIPSTTRLGPVPLTLIVRGGGGEVELPLGQLLLGSEGVGGASIADLELERPPLIAICMATFEPPPERLQRQLDSIRAQGWPRWICLISDDASSPAAFAELERAVAGDPRFVVSRSKERIGFLRNFERAIRMAPAEAELFALADQDDRWYPDKLEALAERLEESPDASLAYSDMRITDGEGRVLSDSYWYLRRNRCEDVASLLVANVVTGAASLFRRKLLDDALPFPPAHPSHALYHDHWLALCALAGSGGIVYLDHPTYDYFRYDDSVTVREAPGWLRPRSGFAGRAKLHLGRLTRRLRMGSSAPSWETVYRERWLLIRQLVSVLELRLGGRIGPRERRAMERLLRAERSPVASAWLLGRCLRPLVGRNETLARERVLLAGLLWRWTAGRGTRNGAS